MPMLARLVFALIGALFLFETAALAETKTFQKPRIDNDERLDWCWSWKVKDCGKRVADQFCARRHHTAATDFKAENAGGRTRFIGSNENCNDKGCVGFAYITCRDQIRAGNFCDSASASATMCEDANPTWNGSRLDRCREWGTNCGQPVADAYCVAKGFTRASYFRTDSEPDGAPTRLIGTNQVCDKPFCRGFQIIRCTRNVGAPKSKTTESNASMVWPLKSTYKYKVEVKLFSRTRDVTWPGQNQVYTFDDSKIHTMNFRCNVGETVCYGAWPAGTNGSTYWGVGKDGKKGCSDCCRTCANGKAEATTLGN